MAEAEAAKAKQVSRLTQQRKGTRGNVRKALNEAKGVGASVTESNAENVEALLGRIERYYTTLCTQNADILPHIEDGNVDGEIEKCCEWEDEILTVISELKAKLKSHDRKVQREATPQVNRIAMTDRSDADANKNKLPKLAVANFAGDPLHWDEFWDDFSSSIHDRPDLSDIDKFKYLRSFLSEEPLRLVQGYRLTSANYKQAVDALKERYGDTELAVFSHLEALLALPSSSHDLVQLRKVFDACESHIRSLVGLGLPESTFGKVFTPIILSKLPRFVKMELYRKNGSKPWTLESLRLLLKEEIEARQRSERAFSGSNPQGTKDIPADRVEKSGLSAKKPVHKPTASALVTVGGGKFTESKKCIYCSQQHYSDECKEFPDYDSRAAKIRGICYSCLRKGHTRRDCPNKRPCRHCGKSGHHRSLCLSKFKGAAGGSKSDEIVSVAQVLNPEAPSFFPNQGTQESAFAVQSTNGRAILQTAIAKVAGEKTEANCRLLFDTASSRSFIVEAKAKEIGARRVGCESFSVGRFRDTKRTTRQYNLYELDLKLPNGKVKQLQVCGVDTISCPLQLIPVDNQNLPIFKTLPLATPLVRSPTQTAVDVLIGSDYYYEFIGEKQIRLPGGVVLLESILGYIIGGKTTPDGNVSGGSDLSLLVVDDTISMGNSLSFSVEKFWGLEEIGIRDDGVQSDDEIALQFFKETTEFQNRRYCVKWPWKPDCPDLPDNYGLAIGRLKALLRRIRADKDGFKLYKNTIEEQERLGIIERAPKAEASRVHYLPHHGVVNPSRVTTKLRIVYDGSAKSSKHSPSLNDCLLRGPVILSDIVGIVMRFRLFRIAIVSDIEKAFLQISLQAEDRDVTRFLWVKDADKPVAGNNVVVYRFCRIPFGIVSSPFLLSASILHLLETSHAQVAESIKGNVYVDNVFAGEQSTEEAIRYYRSAKELFGTATMNLREFYTNSNELREKFEPEDRGKNAESTSVIGIAWNVVHDTVACHVGNALYRKATTKREILRGIASVYDPMGYFAPVIITGRILMQELWQNKYHWDEPIPDDLLKQWLVCQRNLAQIPNAAMPRCVDPDVCGPAVEHQLHCFCDASSLAYAGVVYLRSQFLDRVTTQLLFAKARVRPLKSPGIPRLELVAMLIGSRMIRFVHAQLKLPIAGLYLWSDSTCALQWVLSQSSNVAFVQNRVREIRSKNDISFRYLPTHCNPADLPSRGITFEALKESNLWWLGPAWLQQVASPWPKMVATKFSRGSFEPIDADKEVTFEADTLAVAATPDPENTFSVSRCSSLDRLFRITAYVFRFVNAARGDRSNLPESTVVNAGEYAKARLFWDKRVQMYHFGSLFSKSPDKQSKNLSLQLGLFVDVRGIIRCRGRFGYSSLSEDGKCPKLLPRDNWYTNFVIMDVHRRHLHEGTKHTLAAIRHEYWIIHGRSQVKRELQYCRQCRRHKGPPFRVPDAPQLPDFRTNPRQPFSVVGVDYFGPLFVKVSEKDSKVWVALYTCAVIRAVFLDVVESLSTQDFIMSLRRFTATHCFPSIIVSDNAKQFRAADRFLALTVSKLCNSDQVQEFCAKGGITWKFTTEMAPWMGGFYERMVGIVKKALKHGIDRRCVSMTELQTVLLEVARIVNDRPLLYVETEVGNTALSPSDLMAKGIASMPNMADDPDPTFSQTPVKDKEIVLQYKRVQNMLNSYWKVWGSEYLHELRDQHRAAVQRNVVRALPTVGTVVLVGDKLPRGSWKIAKIQELIYSTDQVCRSVKLRTPDGKCIRRPVKLLFPLEFVPSEQASRSPDVGDLNQNSDQDKPAGTASNRRKAAIVASQKIKQVFAAEELSN